MKQKDKPMLATGAVKVENPHFGPSTPLEHKTVAVQRRLRGDRLALLHHRNQIGDAEFHAGREYQAMCEAAEVGNVGAMDPSRDYVDSGKRLPAVMTDRQMRAIKRMDAIHRALGRAGAAILRAVLVDNLTYPQIALRHYDGASKATVRYVGGRVREVLRELASELGYGKPPPLAN